jgi:hypothetical protein
MFRRTPRQVAADTPREPSGVELTDDQLEHVMGGLERSWTDGKTERREMLVSGLDESPGTAPLTP